MRSLIHFEFALSELETAPIISISYSWLPLDEIYETLFEQNPTLSRNPFFAVFLKNKMNKMPHEQKRDGEIIYDILT